MNNFYKHIFRSSRLQMFFKISALQNFAILGIKRASNTGISCKKQPDGVNILIDFFHRTLITSYFRFCENCEVFKNSFLWKTSGSSRFQMFFKIDALKSFANFTGNHLRWGIFFKNLQTESLQPY